MYNIIYSKYELEKLDVINRETLEVVVKHLTRVAKADNKMDIDNIAVLFGQVLLWPDNEIPMDFGMLAGEGSGSEFARSNNIICRGRQKCESCRGSDPPPQGDFPRE